MAAFVLSACSGSSDHLTTPVITKDVVRIVQGDPQFSTLAEALVAADLAITLKGAGSFTVFAPTNMAFDAVLTELRMTKDALFADKELLSQILTYHILQAKLLKAQLPLDKPVDTLQGESIILEGTTNLIITDQRRRTSKVTATDIVASNGVVHAINSVILPTNSNIVEVSRDNPNFSIVADAIDAAGLKEMLSGTKSFTVFAPTNEAFNEVFNELGITKEAFFADKTLLVEILTYHLVSGLIREAQLPMGVPITTVQGETFTVDATLNITDQSARKVQILIPNGAATNGVVHVIDRVMLPKL